MPFRSFGCLSSVCGNDVGSTSTVVLVHKRRSFLVRVSFRSESRPRGRSEGTTGERPISRLSVILTLERVGTTGGSRSVERQERGLNDSQYIPKDGGTAEEEAETSHSQPLPHFRSFRSDLHLRSGVVRCWPRNQKLIGMTPERGRNEEGRGKKWDAFPLWQIAAAEVGCISLLYTQHCNTALSCTAFLNKMHFSLFGILFL